MRWPIPTINMALLTEGECRYAVWRVAVSRYFPQTQTAIAVSPIVVPGRMPRMPASVLTKLPSPRVAGTIHVCLISKELWCRLEEESPWP